MTDVLNIRDEGRLRVITLNRPDRKNALDGEMLRAIPQAMREASAHDDVWAVALTGAGAGFCSGLDLEMAAEVSEPGADSAPETTGPPEGGEPGAGEPGAGEPGDGEPGDGESGDRVKDIHWSILMRVECEKPIVAGINGIAVGAGVSLALNADVRIAAPSARFHPGYARVATSPDMGLTWTLLRAVGYERAMRFLLEQRMVLAPEALEIGLVSEVVERDEQLEERVVEYGTMLANVAPRAARQTKRLLVALDRPVDLAAHLDTEIELAVEALTSSDGAEAIRALLEGDTPKFTGE